MSIVSIQFLLFVLALIIIYFIVPRKWQWAVLLIANITFYMMSGPKYILYILFSSFVGYYIALGIERVNHMNVRVLNAVEDLEMKKYLKAQTLYVKRMFSAIAIFLIVGIWVFLKYGNFLIDNFNYVLKVLHINYQQASVSYILPLGISFYTFHVVGYVVDVYRAKYHAERNFAKFFVFVSYFPHIIQGPFSRFESLGQSILKEHRFSYERLCEGCARILWGFFKKLIVADKLGVAVNMIFDSYANYTGSHIWFAIFAYCIQLYADFSGYMDIACGVSRILGIELSENFRQPYFAKSIDEFWRRWHITLGKWFADYVFYPVSMGKIGQKLGRKARKRWGAKMGKLVPGYFALFFVWTATGLWHGANWTYLIWGYLNLLVILTTMQLSDTYNNWKDKLSINSEGILWKMVSIVRTFFLVCFFRFFSTTDSLKHAVSMVQYSITELHPGVVLYPGNLFVGMTTINIYVVCFGIICMFIVDLLQEKEKWGQVKENCPIIIKNLWYVLIIIFIVLFAGGNNDLIGGFMYANF